MSETLLTRTSDPLVSGSSERPQTAEEYIDSLKDGREIFIYGEKVTDVTTHPAFRNSVASISRLYSALEDPAQASVLRVPTDTGSGGFTHPFFRVPKNADDLLKSRDAIYAWQKLTCGWMGRSPDYKAAFMVSLGANPEFFGDFADNAKYWYERAQEEVLHIGHAIVHPPVDRSLGFEASKDVFVHVDRETDAGLVVSGAKVVATGAPLTQYCMVSHSGGAIKDKAFSVTFMAPMSGPGIKLVARQSYEAVAARAASPFDYPLSNRFDENDAILIFEEALIPWENVIIYDVDKVSEFNMVEGGWPPLAILQASTRLQVKLEFIIGLVSKALDVTGSGEFRGVQQQLGELITFRHFVSGIRDSMIQNSKPGFGGMWVPPMENAMTYAAMAPGLYTRMRQIIETIVASGLIYLNSNAVDFQVPELRPTLDRFMRGTNGRTALDRSKVMKVLWDSIGSEFGARHELYELNYFGQPEKSYLDIYEMAQVEDLPNFRSFAESFMDEYDLDGWKSSVFTNPSDVSAIQNGRH